VARFYANENIPIQVVVELRRLGHDVLNTLDAGKANSAVPDLEVLAFSAAKGRILVSHNRRHFLQLHRRRTADHAGIVLCTLTRISWHKLSESTQVATESEMTNQLIRVNRPG
jgi:predicted nuclease of predicted toxin-antitoxin system